MEYFSNPGKKSEIVVNNVTYKRHVIKLPPITLNSDLYKLVKDNIVPVYNPGDILCISQKFASICTSSFLYRYDINVSKVAQKAALKVHILDNKSYVENVYAMQLAMILIGGPDIWWASLVSNGSRDKFIKACGRKGELIAFISGLDGTYFPEYENVAIYPPVDPAGICHTIRRDFGISCFISSTNDLKPTIIATSRDMKLSYDTLERMIADNPLGENGCCTPFCIIRDEKYKEPIKRT